MKCWVDFCSQFLQRCIFHQPPTQHHPAKKNNLLFQVNPPTQSRNFPRVELKIVKVILQLAKRFTHLAVRKDPEKKPFERLDFPY